METRANLMYFPQILADIFGSFFWGIIFGFIFIEKKTIKISLLINMQTVHWQMNNPRKRKFAYRTLCGVELAARPIKTSPCF